MHTPSSKVLPKWVTDSASVYWKGMETSEAAQGGKVSTAVCPALVRHREFLYISMVGCFWKREETFQIVHTWRKPQDFRFSVATVQT